MTEANYMLGHSEEEIRRLMIQAAVLRPITERLLRSTGIGWGMRVLDLGCGVGDVSMLAAELVGPSGSVVGIDRSPEVLTVAEQRARSAGFPQISFVEAAADSFSGPEPFDLVIGRYVLIRQPDPGTFIRAAASHVRPKGILAFHEVDLATEARSLPQVPLWDRVGEWILTALQAGLPHYDAANRMLEHFHQADLPAPTLFSEIPVGGGDESPLYAWMAETLRSVLPQLVRSKIATPATIGIEAMEERLRAAVTQEQSQVAFFVQVCGWTRL
jgi:2-polyprenyl-3-methyl-5-hydroxy-6-metoxy-1,4-benzoquinol methylase